MESQNTVCICESCDILLCVMITACVQGIVDCTTRTKTFAKDFKQAKLIHKHSLRAQTALRGVVALRYGVDNEVPQLHATLSEPLD